jgi:putative flippase GtrA
MWQKIGFFLERVEGRISQSLLLRLFSRLPITRNLPLFQLTKYICVGGVNVILSFSLFTSFLWIGRHFQIPAAMERHAPLIVAKIWALILKNPQPNFELIYRQLALFTQWVMVILFSFQLNSRLTFKARNRTLFVLGKFYGVYFFSYLLNAGLLEVLIWLLRVRPELAQLMIIPFTAVISFTGHKFISFSGG